MTAKKGPLATYIEQFVRGLDNYENLIKEITIKIMRKSDGEELEKVCLSIEQYPPG